MLEAERLDMLDALGKQEPHFIIITYPAGYAGKKCHQVRPVVGMKDDRQVKSLLLKVQGKSYGCLPAFLFDILIVNYDFIQIGVTLHDIPGIRADHHRDIGLGIGIPYCLDHRS